MMRMINYIRLGLPGCQQATTILVVMIFAGFVHGGWIGALIILGIFGPYWLAARYEIGKARVNRATRRLLGGERRRPRQPPPAPGP